MPDARLWPVCPSVCILPQVPAVAREALAQNRGVFTAPRVRATGLDCHRSGKVEIFGQIELSFKVIEADGALIPEEAAPAPRVSLWPHRQSSEEWRAADRGPCKEWRPVLCGEIDQSFTGGRQIAAALVDSSLEPLTHSEFMGIRIPSYGQDLPGRPSPEYNGNRGLSGQNDVDPRAWFHPARLLLFAIPWMGS